MTENFPKLVGNMNLYIQDVQQNPTKIQESIPDHIIIRLSKDKDKKRILKSAKEANNQTHIILCKINSQFLIRNHGGLSVRWWHIQSAGRKDYQPRTLCPAKLSFKNEGEINVFPDKKTLRVFIASGTHYKRNTKG